LLHLWCEQCNLTRRILAITDHSAERLTLAVECFGRSKPCRLDFVRVSFERSPRELSREDFRSRLSRVLVGQFPDESLESLVISPDLEHSLSGNYARGLLRRGSAHAAVLGVPDGESSDGVENSLTFALLWFDRARQSARRGSVSSLRLILPKGASTGVAHRIGALDSRFPLELYEHDSNRETLEKIDAKSLGNFSTWLVPHREAQALMDRARSALDPIVALAPQAISVHPVPQSREVFLRFRGLPFARWDDGRVFFGTGDPREELTSASHSSLEHLLHELEVHRNPRASDTRHPFYRAQAERWLESLVREDVTRIDAALDPRFVYAQVFADAGGEHGILDLLAITRSGRLAVLELKASEHIHLPLQAADYWLRARRHLDQGDLARHGYFPGVALQAAAPLVYLVAPALHFHPATDILLRYLSPQLEIIRVGLAERWRRGLRVVTRQ
jgi:PHD/YefM family antitoxin component YafN of YafNO toxin-antitoxin module